MALTVADVLKLKPFATGKVIAGENGVTRKVEHVSVMEGDITEWFSSELVRVYFLLKIYHLSLGRTNKFWMSIQFIFSS